MAAYGAGAYVPRSTGISSMNYNAAPYIEQDKAARTTAIFQGITGLVNSATDFYQRIKLNVKPAAGGYNDPNVYWGGGYSVIPGESGEPTKIAVSGVAGYAPLLLIAGLGLAVVFLAKGR